MPPPEPAIKDEPGFCDECARTAPADSCPQVLVSQCQVCVNEERDNDQLCVKHYLIRHLSCNWNEGGYTAAKEESLIPPMTDECPDRELTVEEKATNAETWAHIHMVQCVLFEVICELQHRALTHDLTKLRDPEVSVFTEMTPKLRTSTFMSDEYKGFLEKMKPALDHHYRHNLHHPQNRPEGVMGMTLVDLIEMLVDWKCAGKRHANGDIMESIRKNTDRFKIPEALVRILVNTVNEFGWAGPESPHIPTSQA